MLKKSMWFLSFLFLPTIPLFAQSLSPRTDDAPKPETVSASTAPFTLRQCYELALKRSESLQLKKEDYEQAVALYKQARGEAFPNIYFTMSDTVQDTSGVNASGATGSLLKRNLNQSRFVLEQPLFAGFKEFSGMSGYKAEENRQQLLYRQATLDLFRDVSNA